MKSAYFATLAVMISLVSAQPSVMRDQDCKNNEEFQTCGSACEPSCDNPNPSFCTLQCVVGCQCEKGFVRNSKKECVKLEECNVVPTTNSPASVPPSSVKCAANETYSDCHNSCSEKKCPVKFAPAIMCMALCQQACGCSAGFARNITGFCIKEADCPKIENTTFNEVSCTPSDCMSGYTCQAKNGQSECVPVNSSVTCSMMRCKSGNICRDIQGRGQCIPTGIVEPAPSCMTMKCGTPGGCVMVLPEGCQSENCISQPMCVNSNPCASTLCASAKECVLRQVTCIKEPCDPVAECVQSSNPPVKPPTCPPNEVMVPCINACSEMNCGQTEPRMCTRECRGPGCACQKGYFRDSSGNCVSQQKCDEQSKACAAMSCPADSECVLKEVQCITTPCNPVAICQSTNVTSAPSACPTNERMVSCYDDCSEKKCGQSKDNSCLEICRGPGCTCDIGLLRSASGQCVKQKDCDSDIQASNGTSLNGTLISPVMPFPPHSNLSLPLPNFNGTVSNSSIPLPTVIPFPVHSNLSVPVSAPPLPMLNGSIFPPTPINANIGITAPPVIHVANGCQNVTCPVGEKCEQAKLECKAPPCNWVSCVPLNPSLNSTVTDGCSVVKCEVGETCQQTKVQCFAPPCPEQISCVKYVDGSDPIDYSGDYDYQVDPIEGFLHNGTHNEHGHGDWTTGGLDPAFNGTGLPPVANGRCDVNETLSTCYNKCVEKKCPGIEKNMFCTKHCGIGCECKDGFLRSREGTCVAWDDCPEESQCEQNEEYRCEKCNPTCQDPDPHCNSKNCKKACKCAEGFVKLKGKCVTLDACPSHTHDNVTCLATEDYTDCTPKCHISCTGKELCDTKMAIAMCKKGCACRNKYKKDTSGACVHNRHCFRSTDCPENEEWAKCRDDEETCDGILFKTTKPPVHDSCYSGCACVSGFARKNGTCVAKDKC